MKKNVSTFLAVSISIMWIFASLSYSLPSSLLITSTLLSNIKSADEIIGVRTYLTLFSIKNEHNNLANYFAQLASNNSSREDYSNRNLLMEWLKTNPIRIGVMPTHVNYLTSTFSHFNLSIIEGKSSLSNSSSVEYFKIYPSFDSCQKRNYLEKYDAVLMDPYLFAVFVRFYKDTVSNGVAMESRNFYPIPLIPYEVYTKRQLTSNEKVLTDLFHVETATSCENQPDVSDGQYFRLLTGYSNFSSQDISIIERITGATSLTGNWSLINSNLPSILSSLRLSESYTTNLTNVLDKFLLPSDCYMCKTSTCAAENFNPVLDYWIIPQFCIIFAYFLILFSFGLYKKPSMRRRIALPYAPILVLTCMVMFTNLSRICICVFYNISTFVIIWLVFIYSATIIRFYYLRNLYSLITKFPNREKLLKILASEKSGVILTAIIPFIFALLFNIFGIFLFFNESKTSADIFRPALFMSFIIAGSIIGFLIVIWDMIVNSKRIGKYGLISFLVFDDPLYVRLDMLSLFILVILALLVVLGQIFLESTNFSVASGILNTIICIGLLLVTGGNTVIIELFKKIRYLNNKNNTDDLETVLKNEDLFGLLKEYSEKEFSSENIEFYSVLLKLKEQKCVSVKHLDNIDDTFIKNYSKFEVNLPSSCKREFYALKEKAREKSQIEYSALWDVIGSDLVMNMMDTFKRLQETSNYRKWESVSKYQKHIHP